jgi:preprotein translocase subunit SecF
MELFRETHINFIGARKFTYAFSIITLLISVGYLIIRGGPKLGIDFTGGSSIQLNFQNAVTIGQIRSSLSNIGLGTAEIKHIGAADVNSYIIRVGQLGEGVQVAQQIQDALHKDLPDHPYEVWSVTEIGPKIGGELRRAATMSVIVALIGLLIYISWRFEFKFAVGAVIATFHDVFFVLGIFTILGMEMSLTVLAAFLTIVGYSINDTIVVYDRIRENLKILRRENLGNIMNISVNQTLSRTLLTGVSTLVVLLILIIMGGEVIHDFSLTLFIGTIIGTYSSIYVASVLVLDWHVKVESKKGHKAVLNSARG